MRHRAGPAGLQFRQALLGNQAVLAIQHCLVLLDQLGWHDRFTDVHLPIFLWL
jgi:hypothetical protein